MCFHLVCIDDEKDLLELESELIQERFEQEGKEIKIETFSSATDALFWLRENITWPDAVLTDLQMPLATGLEVVRFTKMNTKAECMIYSGFTAKYEVNALNEELVSYGKTPAMCFDKPDVSGTLGIPGYLLVLAEAKMAGDKCK